MNDIFVHYIKLPIKAKGLVVPTDSGDYNIIINTSYSYNIQMETYEHEMRHIELGHYEDNLRPIHELEAEANDKTLLKKEIRIASIQGLSAPLFPTKTSTPSQTPNRDNTIVFPTHEMHKNTPESSKAHTPINTTNYAEQPPAKTLSEEQQKKLSLEELKPYLLPHYDDPVEALDAILAQLEKTKAELQQIRAETPPSTS